MTSLPPIPILYGSNGQPLAPTSTYPTVDDDDTSPRKLDAYQQLPVYGFRPHDRVWQLENSLRALESGVFPDIAQQCDAMLRDDAYIAAWEQRNAGLFGAELCVEAADEDAQSTVISESLEDLWDYMHPRSELERMNLYGTMLGVCIVQKIWDTSARPWRYRMEVIHPQFYIWRWDLNAFQVVTRNGGLVTVPRRSTQWMVHTPYGYNWAYIFGRIRSLTLPLMMRGWTRSDWGHWLELHAKGITKAIVPQNANPKQEAQFVNAVANRGNNTTVKVRQDKDGNKYDIQLVEAMNQGWEGYERMLHWCDDKIATVLLGQAMSTKGVGGLGSQEKPGEAVRLDVKKSDNQRVVETVKGQGVDEWTELNYGDAKKSPMFYWQIEPPADTGAITAAHLAQANADAVYIDRGWPIEECLIARFGKGEWSPETEIDVRTYTKMLKAALKEIEQHSKNDLEAAKDPESTPGDKEKQAQQKPPVVP